MTSKVSLASETRIKSKESTQSSQLSLLSLGDLLLRYFKEMERHDFVQNVTLQMKNGRRQKIDFWFEKDRFGLLVLDWARSCGINVVIRTNNLRKELPGLVDRIGIAANFFSEPAEVLAQKMDVIMVLRKDIEEILSIRDHQNLL